MESTGLLRIARQETDAPHNGPHETIVRHKKSTFMHVCSFIIANEFCERLAFYGFQGSLVLYLKSRLGVSSARAASQAAMWNGACYITPVIGGIWADSFVGRYTAILQFITVYQIGLLLVCIEVSRSRPDTTLFFVAMYTIALGAGGIKPNVSTFGADQFCDADPRDRIEKEQFFGWFYLAINCGAMIAFTVVAYLCQNVSFAAGYSVPAVAMLLAIAAFVAGSPRYRHAPAPWLRVSGTDGSDSENGVGGTNMGLRGSFCTSLAIIRDAWHIRQCSRESISGCGDRLSDNKIQQNGAQRDTDHGTVQLGWLAGAAETHGGRYDDHLVAAVWRILRLLPFLGLLVVYWAVYSQMSTTFFLQACQMDLTVGHLVLPIASLNLFDTLAIIILVPLCNTIMYPWLEARGVRLSMLRKIGGGFVLAALAMLCATFIEIERVARAQRGEFSKHANPCVANTHSESLPYNVVQMSVLWQIPQFILIGASEVFTSITAIEFFFAEAPESMRSVCAAANLSTNAFGACLVALTVPLVKAWLPDNLNVGQLATYFAVLALAMLVNLALFVVCARSYIYADGSVECHPSCACMHNDNDDDGLHRTQGNEEISRKYQNAASTSCSSAAVVAVND